MESIYSGLAVVFFGLGGVWAFAWWLSGHTTKAMIDWMDKK